MITAGVKQKVQDALRKRGLSIQREFGSDLDPQTVDTIERVRPYTMTTVERVAAVCQATEYILRYDIPGAFVESGVWMGGSSMAAATTLVKNGVTDREIFMYDTYEGLPEPGVEDAVIGSDHQSLKKWYDAENSRPGTAPWLEAPVDQVREHMRSTGYDIDRVHLIQGMVEDTIPATAPEQIAFLRLDTDWYASTKVELENLFPRLSPGGILIVDDYGYTTGARKAVDEFLATYPDPIFLNRIDSCGRLVVKPGLASS
ncbi:TylF/MycF/NovP-related O-methyltransferase [Nocardioides sp.]|uniref:TylF/MycF/NovP-related O-methyltransferase n=1 Tax=Nocardioides sp. TaxID=35761 RepID=UPI002734E139|nr:TylF/MycF/NovP-related O-methyltransferase [Nocardioides sp.]MDP3894580.1 TylF/MycF/NovP-related O-methyltransferase [Nocardioides sp.]